VSTPSPCLSCRQRFPRARGLCPTCYDRSGLAVRSGETSWARLEAAGLALPAAPAGSAWRKGFVIEPRRDPPAGGGAGV
jgi:hypothetical protein